VESIDQESITKVIVVRENQSHESVNDNGGESVERLTSSSSQEQQESEGDTDNEIPILKQYKQKTRRDSGWYPPNWNMLLTHSEPHPPTLAGITEVRT